MDDPDPDYGKLGAPGFLDDGEGNRLEVGAAALGTDWCGRTLPGLTAVAAGDLDLILDATTEEFFCLATDRAHEVECHVPVSPRASTRDRGSAPVARPRL